MRIKNLMLPPDANGSREEGGLTLYQHDGLDLGHRMAIFDAAMQYQADGVPTVVLRGRRVRHGVEPRLGRQGHATAGHQGGGGQEL